MAGSARAPVRVAAVGWQLGARGEGEAAAAAEVGAGTEAGTGVWIGAGAGVGAEAGPNAGAGTLRKEIEARLLAVKEAGARLVVLPGYAGSILAKVLAAGKDLAGTNDEVEATGASVGQGPTSGRAQGQVHAAAVEPIRDLVVFPAQEKAYLAWASDWARRLRGFLVPGSVLVAEGKTIYHQAYLLSPGGEVLGRQRQTHLRAVERARGLAAGEELLVFPTEIGSIGLVVGGDAWYPEVSRILTLQGADILVAPLTLLTPYPKERQWAGMWQEVQQNQTFAIECGLEGCLGGLEFHAQTAVMAPCEMTPGQTGYLGDPALISGQITAGRQTGILGPTLICDLDFSARQELIANYDILSLLNLDLYRRYFPGLYRLVLRNGGEGAGHE